MNRMINKWFLLLIVSSAIFLSVIDLFIVNVAVPSIKEGIRGSDGDIQLVIVLYVIGYASFLITGGRARSEERRVGKECRSRWWRYHRKKKKRSYGCRQA